MKKINKSTFLNNVVCQTKGWHLYNQPTDTQSTLGEQLRCNQGQMIGKFAQKLYPNGILVPQSSTKVAEQETKELINDPSVPAIFEAALQAFGGE